MPSGRSVQDRLTAQRIVPSFVDDARRADADAEDRLVRAGQDLVDQVVDQGEGGVAVLAVEVLADPFADLAAEVEKGCGEGSLAEVEGDHMAGVVDERDERRLLAAGAGAAADLLGEALLLELSDELPDRGAGQAGEAGDLRAADRAEVVDGTEDQAGVVGARLGVRRLGRELGPCHERDWVLLDVIDPLRRLRPHDVRTLSWVLTKRHASDPASLCP